MESTEEPMTNGFPLIPEADLSSLDAPIRISSASLCPDTGKLLCCFLLELHQVNSALGSCLTVYLDKNLLSDEVARSITLLSHPYPAVIGSTTIPGDQYRVGELEKEAPVFIKTELEEEEEYVDEPATFSHSDDSGDDGGGDVGGAQYECMHCDANFNTWHELDVHQATHAPPGAAASTDHLVMKDVKVSLTKLEIGDDVASVMVRPRPGRKGRKKFASRHKEVFKRPRKVEPLEKMRCETCGREFKYKSSFLKHVRQHGREDAGEEEETLILSSTRRRTSRQQATEQQPRMIKNPRRVPKTPAVVATCDLCNRNFRKKKLYKKHLLEVHAIDVPKKSQYTNQKPLKCSICDREFKKSLPFRKHVAKHKQIHSLQTSRPAAPAPVTTHQDSQDLYCQRCDRSFRNQSVLDQHMKSHEPVDKSKWEGKKPYEETSNLECNICERIFTQRPGYKLHMAKHAIKEKAKEKARERRKELNAMITESSNGPPRDYICEICGREFCYAGPYKKHMNDHGVLLKEPANQLLSNTCRICFKVLKTRKSYLRHVARHRARKKVQSQGQGKAKKKKERTDGKIDCEFCRRTFKHECVYREHLQYHKKQGIVTTSPIFSKLAVEVLNQPDSDDENPGQEKPAEKTAEIQEKPEMASTSESLDCTVCGKTLRSLPYLEMHMEGHKRVNIYSYQCKICGKTFAKSARLKIHMYGHTKDDKFVCQVCGSQFNKPHELRAHLKEAHQKLPDKVGPGDNTEQAGPGDNTGQTGPGSDQPGPGNPDDNEQSSDDQDTPATFPCPVCDQVFKLEIELQSHIQESHPDYKHKAFVCRKCGEGFVRKGELKRHLERKACLGPYKCSVCKKEFKSLPTLEYHALLHSGTKNHVCPICDKAYTYRCSLTYHMRSHDGEAKELCNICGKEYANRGGLKRHLLIHAGIFPHKCTQCDKAFTVRSHLVKHMLKHSEGVPYMCEVCGATLKNKNGLQSHMRRHNMVKKISCPICNLKFYYHSQLELHRAIHEKPAKSWTCPHCSKKPFKDFQAYSLHMERHQRGMTLIPCPRCDKKFDSTLGLKNHDRFCKAFHESDQVYQCDFCDRVFLHTMSLRLHMKKCSEVAAEEEDKREEEEEAKRQEEEQANRQEEQPEEGQEKRPGEEESSLSVSEPAPSSSHPPTAGPSMINMQLPDYWPNTTSSMPHPLHHAPPTTHHILPPTYYMVPPLASNKQYPLYPFTDYLPNPQPHSQPSSPTNLPHTEPSRPHSNPAPLPGPQPTFSTLDLASLSLSGLSHTK